GRPTVPCATRSPSRGCRRRTRARPPASSSGARRGGCGRDPAGPPSTTLDDGPQAVEVVGERARLECRALVALLPGACPRRGECLLEAVRRDDRGAVGVEHDRVAGTDGAAADLHGLADRPDLALRRAADPDPAR